MEKQEGRRDGAEDDRRERRERIRQRVRLAAPNPTVISANSFSDEEKTALIAEICQNAEAEENGRRHISMDKIHSFNVQGV